MQLAGDEQTRRTAIIVLVDVVCWCGLAFRGAVSVEMCVDLY